MASDTGEIPIFALHPPPFSKFRHFYVALDRFQFKMETLIDLLSVAGRRNGLTMVVCCSSRDELDATCAAISTIPFISHSVLYSDLAESERADILKNFHQACLKWNQQGTKFLLDDEKVDVLKSYVLIMTDACLPLLDVGEPPLCARFLINYEFPHKKEIYWRRITSCLSTDGVAVNMVTGGEVEIIKSIEASSNLIITEMPINIFEIL